jgi:hypothetical protein
MSFLEIVRGIGNLLFVMLLAGAVAYVGDRVGHQVGRRRLSLFGIRPRYTSTIVAIATGMLIALVVTLGAIFASQEVKTAFFQLSTINQRIIELQAKERDLEAKVNTGRLVYPVDTLMYPYYRMIAQSATQAQRAAIVRQYYFEAVKWVNANYPQRLGLKPYVIPADVNKKLSETATLAQDLAMAPPGAGVMLTITSDQNLFERDPIHFAINVTKDVRFYKKGQAIAQLSIPGGSGANIEFAISQLQNYVSADARRLGMPPFIADNVVPGQLIPSVQQMSQEITNAGVWLLTAYAAEDCYPHIGGIPVVFVLTHSA